MKIGSREFVRRVNGKAFNAIFISYARRILPDMREFFQTEEGKAYLADWLKKIEICKERWSPNSRCRSIRMRMMTTIIDKKFAPAERLGRTFLAGITAKTYL